MTQAWTALQAIAVCFLLVNPLAAQTELPWRLRNEPRIARAELEAFLAEQELEASDAAIILRSAHDDLMTDYADLGRLRLAEPARDDPQRRGAQNGLSGSHCELPPSRYCREG